MGYPLLRAADYPRFDAFIGALTALEETDLLDPQRLEPAVAEAERFHVFLTELFEQIGQRDELKDVPFDRRAAAESLKLYLGDSAGAHCPTLVHLHTREATRLRAPERPTASGTTSKEELRAQPWRSSSVLGDP